jgi:hypothetical protein
MNENENLVTEVAENAEQTAEQTPKTYTDEEVNAIVGKRLARQESKLRREYDRKYGRLEEVLTAGTGITDVSKMADTFAKHYEENGVTIKKTPEYSAKDLSALAKADAAEFIEAGDEEVADEVDRLADLGENMTAREKAVFKVLAEHRQQTERTKELARLGVSEEVYNSPEFKELQNMMKPDTPISKVYEMYQKTKPKKDIQPMGSMKSNAPSSGVKDYYSPEEARRLTKEEINDPAVYNAVVAYMKKWK